MSEPYRIGKLTRTRADGTKYWSFTIQWLVPGEGRKRVSLGTTDKAAAAARARDFWSQYAVGSADTIGSIVDAYLDTLPKPYDGWKRNDGADPVGQSKIKSAQRRREGWKQAKPFWGKLLPSQVDAVTSTDYMKWRGVSPNTMRHELGPIYSAMAWAVSQRIIAVAPPIKLPAIPESSVGHLTKAEFRQFLTGCTSPHVMLFAVLAVTTGARATALMQLPWSSVDFARGLIKLKPEGVAAGALKGRATVPINDRLLPILQEAKAGAMSDYVVEYHGEPVASILMGFRAAAIRSGIKVHPHMLRHSAAVWMAEDRVPMAEIASYLGHKDVNITIRVYARFAPDYLREAAKSLDW
jgi:integrase